MEEGLWGRKTVTGKEGRFSTVLYPLASQTRIGYLYPRSSGPSLQRLHPSGCLHVSRQSAQHLWRASVQRRSCRFWKERLDPVGAGSSSR